jgi:hypothetical protein
MHEKVKAFQAGNKDLSAKDLNDIKVYLLEYKSLLKEIQFFQGSIKNNRVVSCFSESYQEELKHYMYTKFNAAIAIVVSLSAQKVYLTKEPDNCTIRFEKLNDLLFNNQGNIIDENTTVGPITANFLKLSKQLSTCS